MVNPMAMMKLMNAKNQFEKNHPKFVAFFQTILTQGIEEGSIIEITVTKPDGTPVTANMRVQKSDLEMVEQLKDLAASQK